MASPCSEFYTVAKSVEFVKRYGGTDRAFRVDALFDPESARYSTAVYIRETVILQPAYPQTNGKFEREPESMEIWRTFHTAWTSGLSSEQVIAQAIGFIG